MRSDPVLLDPESFQVLLADLLPAAKFKNIPFDAIATYTAIGALHAHCDY